MKIFKNLLNLNLSILNLVRVRSSVKDGATIPTFYLPVPCPVFWHEKLISCCMKQSPGSLAYCDISVYFVYSTKCSYWHSFSSSQRVCLQHLLLLFSVTPVRRQSRQLTGLQKRKLKQYNVLKIPKIRQ